MENVDNLFTGKPESYQAPAMDAMDGAGEVKSGDDGFVQPGVGKPAPQQEPENQNFNQEELDQSDSEIEYGEEDNHPQNAQEYELDDYGNEQKKQRMYTEEEAREMTNRAIRERLARFEKNNPAMAEQARQDFQYNPESGQDWEVQLEQFMERAWEKREARRIQQAQIQQEQQANMELESKIQSGVTRFGDFVDVVGTQPITDHMVKAVRGLKDPAAFLYAASKHQAPELKRISEIQDPYAQAREMGKLEERMRKTSKASSRAPRPLGRTIDDGNTKTSVEREPSIDQRINDFAQKRAPQRR